MNLPLDDNSFSKNQKLKEEEQLKQNLLSYQLEEEQQQQQQQKLKQHDYLNHQKERIRQTLLSQQNQIIELLDEFNEKDTQQRDESVRLNRCLEIQSQLNGVDVLLDRHKNYPKSRWQPTTCQSGRCSNIPIYIRTQKIYNNKYKKMNKQLPFTIEEVYKSKIPFFGDKKKKVIEKYFYYLSNKLCGIGRELINRLEQYFIFSMSNSTPSTIIVDNYNLPLDKENTPYDGKDDYLPDYKPSNNNIFGDLVNSIKKIIK
jgi:hypothetical protein